MPVRSAPSRRGPLELLRALVLDDLNGRWHRPALLAYLSVVLLHFSEHALQLFQIFVLGVPRAEAGGLLGGVLPGLVENELLHTAYNSAQLTGLILLLPGFRGTGRARIWWVAALVFQSWHWLEHAFLQAQVLTGVYFYGALKQTSVLERFVPRAELHFVYNLNAFLPTVVALAILFAAGARRRRAAR